MSKEELLRLIKWLTGDDTGVSSRQIASVMIGEKPTNRFGFPYDPSDLGRCLRLLELFPDFDIWSMHSVSDGWWKLVNHWKELTDIYNSEKDGDRATKTYEFMSKLRYGKDETTPKNI